VHVVVVGAGIVGLSTALELVSRRHRVTMMSDLDIEATTSAVAAASFKPRLVAAGPVTTSLLRASQRTLARWARDGRGAGMGLSRITHVEASAAPLAPRDYLHAMTDVRVLDAADGDALPPGCMHGVAYRTWFLDVGRALPALRGDLAAAGVGLVHQHVDALDDATVLALEPDVVVNATGMGAAALVEDPGLVAVRGQVVAIDRGVSDVATSVSADDAYVYPRGDDIVLGGTADRLTSDQAARALAGARGDHSGTSPMDPDEAVTATILARAGEVLGWLDDAVGDPGSWPITAVRVGLRPWRPSGVRLEVVDDASLPVVHAYGHGGAGWTLAPGTAEWVADAVDDLD